MAEIRSSRDTSQCAGFTVQRQPGALRRTRTRSGSAHRPRDPRAGRRPGCRQTSPRSASLRSTRRSARQARPCGARASRRPPRGAAGRGGRPPSAPTSRCRTSGQRRAPRLAPLHSALQTAGRPPRATLDHHRHRQSVRQQGALHRWLPIAAAHRTRFAANRRTQSDPGDRYRGRARLARLRTRDGVVEESAKYRIQSAKQTYTHHPIRS